MSNEMAVREPQALAELSVQDVLKQVSKIQEVMKAAMKNGEHYGVVPGVKKPFLFKGGAEKLCLLFRLEPQYEVISSTERDDFISYVVKCTLYHIPTGQRVGSGIAPCNSKEAKYRYRWVDGKKVENTEIWDMQNTLMKMAEKRAHVMATLGATAASDLFTQDPEAVRPEPAKAAGNGQAATQPAQPTAKKPYNLEGAKKAYQIKCKQYLATIGLSDDNDVEDWRHRHMKEVAGIETLAEAKPEHTAKLLKDLEMLAQAGV